MIKQHILDKLNAELLPPVDAIGDLDIYQSNILFHRLNTMDYNLLKEYIDGKFDIYQDIEKLPDIEKASIILSECMKENYTIIIAGDRDCDGLTASVVSYLGLITLFNYDELKIKVIINKRVEENGISKYIMDSIDRIIDNEPNGKYLLLTVDHGSVNENEYKILKSKGLKIIVTDHHTVQYDYYPDSADAFINPQRNDSTYPFIISGCQVALLLMAYLYRYNGNTDISKLNNLLTYAGLSVISDVMPLNNTFNRSLVRTALNEINKYNNSFWKNSRKLFNIVGSIDTKLLGYKIAPLINTANRTHNETVGYRALLPFSDILSLENIQQLEYLSNIKRKELVRCIKEAENECYLDLGKNAVVVGINTHAAIEGIVAAMLSEKYNKPFIVYSVKNDTCTASLRAGDVNIHMLNILHKINEEDNILTKYGGHKQSCGLSFNVDNIDRLKELFNKYVKEAMEASNYVNKTKIDMELKPDEINPVVLSSIAVCEPYGKDFGQPLFISKLKIERMFKNYKLVNFTFNNGLTAKVFDPDTKFDCTDYKVGDSLYVVFSFSFNKLSIGESMELEIINIYKDSQ